jgi:hypothetical protein
MQCKPEKNFVSIAILISFFAISVKLRSCSLLRVSTKESETALEKCGSVEILAFEIWNMGRSGSALQSFLNLNKVHLDFSFEGRGRERGRGGAD